MIVQHHTMSSVLAAKSVLEVASLSFDFCTLIQYYFIALNSRLTVSSFYISIGLFLVLDPVAVYVL